MKKHISILYSILAILAFSCHPSSEYPEKMFRAEQCIDAYPDSALTLLNSLQTIIFQKSKETQMYHHLLTIEAKYKCYLPFTTDSLITIVADYYKRNGNRDKTIKAYYLKGCIYGEFKDMPQALKCYQQALQLSEDSKQYHTLALLYNQIGNVYLYQDMNKEAILMFQEAYRYFEKAEVFAKLQDPIRNIARAYSELQERDSAINYYKKAYELAVKSKNKSARNALLNELGGYFMCIGKYELASKVLYATDNKENDINYIGWGLLYQHTNRLDSAKYYFQKSIETAGSIYTTAGAYLHLAELEETAGNYQKAFRLLRTHQQWQDSIKKITNTEIAQRMHSMYNYQRKEAENQKLKEDNMQKELWLYQAGILFIVITVAGTGYILYRKRKKRQTTEIEKKTHEMKEKQYAKSIEQIAVNSRLIDQLQLKLNQTKKEKQALIETQVKSLEAMNHQIQSKKEERDIKEEVLRKSDIYSHFHSQDSISITEQEWEELKIAIDDTYDNFTGQLYTLYPKLSTIEMRICLLIKISITVTNISMLLGRSKSTVSTARSKLYEKLQGVKGTPGLLDQFIVGL